MRRFRPKRFSRKSRPRRFSSRRRGSAGKRTRPMRIGYRM